MPSRICSSSLRACRSSSRWNRIEVCRMRSTRSNTSAPSWSRTVSPRMRPSSRMSFRSRVSSSSAWASSARLDLISASEGMIWGDIDGLSRSCPADQVCKFFAAAQDEDGGVLSNPPPRPFPIGIAQAALEDLARILPRQAGLDFDVLRHLVVGKRGLQPGADVRRHPASRRLPVPPPPSAPRRIPHRECRTPRNRARRAPPAGRIRSRRDRC